MKSEELKLIKSQLLKGNIDEAEAALKAVDNKDNDYYLLKAVMYHKKGWLLDSRKQMDAIKAAANGDNYSQYEKEFDYLTGAEAVGEDMINEEQTEQEQSESDNKGKKPKKDHDCCLAVCCCEACGGGCCDIICDAVGC
ncbi:MAG: hypothetical protein ACOX3U_04695 [Christensenellales bacterium]|jgi:hypothetical protein